MTTQVLSLKKTDFFSNTFVQISLATVFLAACASIRIPLPFTPVPLSLQTFGVMLVGGALGANKGASAVLLYLLEAFIGLPVLAGGHADSYFLLSPTAGYLIGFVFQAYFSGKISEKAHILGKSKTLIGYFLASLITLGLGACWLSQFVGLSNALLLGVIPFLPGDFIKIYVATTALKFIAKQE